MLKRCLLSILLLAVSSALAQKSAVHHELQTGPQGSGGKPGSHKAQSPLRYTYTGDDACSACHQDKVATFHQTAHYITSRLPGKESILGNFTSDSNVLKTSVPDLFFRMEEKDDGFFQTAVEGIPPDTKSRTERFGLVIGAGGTGQTFLYWKGDELFELPVSYWNQLGWVNSPGYQDGDANFDRAIVPRCLECHATYFEPIPSSVNRYRTSGFLVGITCEKCHGPGRHHVELEAAKARKTSGSAILNPGRFSRERQLDLCAWCHGGRGTGVAPAFSYLPGEPLDKYIRLQGLVAQAPTDVHGDQVDLLKKSRCFQSSTMTCLTCHDVHTTQHDLRAFSQVCLSCHKPGTDRFPKMGHQVDGECISCHMPKQDTNLIVFDWKGDRMRPQVRTHWIKTYPNPSTKVEAQ